MSSIVVTVSSASIPETVVNPVFKGGFTFSKDKKRIRYKHELDAVLFFNQKADYDLLIPLENNECEVVTVVIQWGCGSNLIEYWVGEFSMSQCNPNRTRKWIKVKPKQSSPYKCFDDAAKLEHSIYDAGDEITSTAVIGEYETIECTFATPTGENDLGEYFDLVTNGNNDCIDPGDIDNWAVLSNNVFINDVFYDNTYPQPFPAGQGVTWYLSQVTIWHRETLTVPCSGGVPVPPSFGTWELLTDDCAADGTATWWRSPPVQLDGGILGDYTKGRLFSDVLIDLIDSLGCGFTVKSDFFNINPLGDAPTNIAYDYAIANLQNMTVHQRSDIKLKNGPNFSNYLAWKVKAKDYIDDLIKIFNVRYVIEDNVFILEHSSFFTSDQGWDLTHLAIEEDVDYSGGVTVKIETFFWAEEYLYSTFESEPIVYDCGEDDVDVKCKYFVTDLSYVQRERNAEKVSDKGLVLISNAVIDGTYGIIESNDPLKWSNLQDNLFLHGRLYKSGTINGVQHNFLTWEPYIKQKEFNHVYRCSDTFIPINYMPTSYGNGFLTEGKHNILDCSLTLNLNY